MTVRLGCGCTDAVPGEWVRCTGCAHQPHPAGECTSEHAWAECPECNRTRWDSHPVHKLWCSLRGRHS